MIEYNKTCTGGMLQMPKNVDELLNKIDEKLDEVSDTICNVDKELALQKAAFDEHIKQDEKMYEEFRRMNDILQSNTDSLKEHMAQTQLLKDTVMKIDARLAPIEIERIEEEAIKEYRSAKLKKFSKIVGVIATATGILTWAKPFLLKLLGL